MESGVGSLGRLSYVRPPPAGSRNADHGRVAGCGIVRRDGGDDLLVLLERLLGTAGAEDRSVLEPDALRLERDQHLGGDLVVRDLPDPPMERRVELHVAERVVLAEAVVHRGHDLSEIGDVAAGGLGGCAPGEEPFECVAHLFDFECLARRDQPDPGPAMGFANDEPLLVEHRQRCPDGSAAHPQTNREVRLDEALVGLELAADDGLTEAVAGVGDRANPAPVRIGGGGWIVHNIVASIADNLRQPRQGALGGI